MGRKLPKRECPTCGRMVSIMSNVTRDKLRAHTCNPKVTTPAPAEHKPCRQCYQGQADRSGFFSDSCANEHDRQLFGEG